MIKKLNKAEEVIKSSKVKKILQNPFQYIYAFAFRKIIFPYIKKSSLVQRNTFFGETFFILLPAAIDIFIYGTKSHPSEIRLAKFIINHLKPDNNFVDVGAHFGFFSSLAANVLKGKGRVISFEASTYTFEVLKMNTENHKTIEINHKACSNKNELLDFYEFPIDYSEYNSMNKKQYENTDWLKNKQPKKHTVQAIRLDEELEGFDIDIIKIDVEGAEFQVVEGMKSILEQKKVNYVVLEYLLNDHKIKPHQQAAKYLLSQNYYPFGINKDGFLDKIENNDIDNYLKTIDFDSDNIVFKNE